MGGMRERKRVARRRAPAQGAALQTLAPDERTGGRGRPRVPYFRYRAHCTERRVLVWLRYGGASYMEIIAGVNRYRQRTDQALQTLMRAGIVVRPRRGWYELANPSEFARHP